MDALIERLSHGDHPVTVGGPNPSVEELKKRLEELGYVFIKFTDTQGGTDVGVRIDRSTTHIDQSQFEQRSGTIHIEGTLTLNYVNVRCVADINLATLNGIGHLNVLEEIHR